MSSSGSWRIVVLGCAIFFAAVPVTRADSTEAKPSSTAEAQSLYQKIGEKAELTYFGVYRGAPVNDLGASLQPTTSGQLDPTSPQSLESYVTTGYKLNKDLMVGVSNHIYYYPVGLPAGTGQDLQYLDPSLVVARSNWINRSGFKLKGMLFATIPLSHSDFLLKHDLATAISPTVVISYDVPKTRLNLGLYAYLTAYIPTASTASDVRTYKIYAAPNATYQLTKTVAATLWIDLIQTTRNGGTGFISGMDNYTADVEPGINWDITPKISVNPMLNIYPANPTLASTSLQAVVIAKAF